MMTNIMTTMTIMSEVGEPHIHHMLYILQIKPEVGPRKKYLNFQQSQSNSQADMRTSAVIENITRNNATTNFFTSTSIQGNDHHSKISPPHLL